MPIGTDSFEPTKVSRATVFPSFSVALRLTWGTINLKSVGAGQLQYAATDADTNYYNIAKDLARVNARNEEITDRQGNLYGYWCKVQTTSVANDLLGLCWCPNTWKVRNAFRKFHFARESMFRDAGVTKREMGKYGRSLRPYFSRDHLAETDQRLLLFDPGSLGFVPSAGGEWTYTTLASAPTMVSDENMEDVALAPVDEWKLTILDSHDTQATSGEGVKTWVSVGMVQAYNQDRMEEIPDATGDTSVIFLNNPLASLQTQTLTTGEILEIASDQQLEHPPYDISDDGDSTEGVFEYMPVGGTTAGATAARRNWGLFFFPAGIVALQNSVTGSNALSITVIGKELCKDVA